MEINLKDQIVILDEGHNIEDSAREAASFKFTLVQVNEALGDISNMSEWGLGWLVRGVTLRQCIKWGIPT